MIPDVEDEPYVALERWHFIQEIAGFRLVGLAMTTGRGRVTSPVVEYDHAEGRAVTESGRVYRLTGPADPDYGARCAVAHMMKYGLEKDDVALVDAQEIADLQDAQDVAGVPRRGWN